MDEKEDRAFDKKGLSNFAHADDEFGSIECGKAADFTVLEGNPLTVDPMSIRDIGVWGTIVGGAANEAAEESAMAEFKPKL